MYKLHNILRGHEFWVTSVAFSPEGNFLATSSMDNTIKIWRLPEATLADELVGHSDIVTRVVFSPDGNILSSSSNDNTIRLWINER